MKTKSFLFSMLFLAAILVGCEKPQTQTGQEGETNSYITVAVKSSVASRAATDTVADGGYITGTDAENAITSIDFYFFATTGEPFKFNSPVSNNTTSAYSNLYTVGTRELDEFNGTMNVEEVAKVTLALQHNLGDYPGSVVAIVNGTQRFENLPIEDFRTHTFNSYQTTKGFLMSNSVYKDPASGKEIFQTPIKPENFTLTKEAALANPIDIYVERSAVRVEVAQGTADTKFDTGVLLFGSKKVYAKITGWDIVTVPNHAYTVKRIDINWPDQINGFTWNKSTDFRSFWADAQFPADSIVKSFKYSDLTNPVGLGKYDYCLENTTLPIYTEVGGVHDQVASRTNTTKVVIAADLVDDANQPVEVANWYGKDYLLEDLKIAVANSLKDKMFYGEGGGWKSIKPEQIKLVQGSGLPGEEESYEIYFQLTDEATNNYNWAEDLDGNVGISSDKEQDYIRKNVEVAKFWNGKSYYIVDIQHLGKKEMDGTTYLPAYYGTVRNHAYQITFSAVKGLGTPVYSELQDIPEPIKPDDTESFIEAEINVLSWHLIQQNVTLQ